MRIFSEPAPLQAPLSAVPAPPMQMQTQQQVETVTESAMARQMTLVQKREVRITTTRCFWTLLNCAMRQFKHFQQRPLPHPPLFTHAMREETTLKDGEALKISVECAAIPPVSKFLW